MSDMITNHADIDVFIGIDVGKHNHHAVALDSDGKQLLSKALPQNETKLRALLNRLAKHGTLLVVVDQPATIGALPVAVAQAEDITVAYLPGLATTQVAKAIWGDDVQRVQYQAARQNVVPFSERNDKSAERPKIQPVPVGWRALVTEENQSEEEFAKYFCASDEVRCVGEQ